MSDICEKCGCPEGVDGHDVLYRQIDELKKAAPNAINNLSKAIGSMDAEERSVLCKRIEALEKTVTLLHGALHSYHNQAFTANDCQMEYCRKARRMMSKED